MVELKCLLFAIALCVKWSVGGSDAASTVFRLLTDDAEKEEMGADTEFFELEAQ